MGMIDVLIRNVPDEDLRRIDAKAQRQGIGRAEYVRRLIAREAGRADDTAPLTLEALTRFADLTADLLAPDFEHRAWT